MEHNAGAGVLNTVEKKKGIDGGDGYMGSPVHSQVMKIRREIEKIKHASVHQAEMRRVLLRGFARVRTPSPLGLTERPISVGNS